MTTSSNTQNLSLYFLNYNTGKTEMKCQGNKLSVQIKKDALWKPIIRSFRRYIRSKVLAVIPKTTENQIMEKRAQAYKMSLDIPDELQKLEYAGLAILLIVDSPRITCKRKIIPECKERLGAYLRQIQPNFFDVFQENTKRTRLAFFSDKLIQFLWVKYR